MKIITLDEISFDKFANTHKYRNYYQTSAYGRTIKNNGYDIHYIGIIDDSGNLLGASLLLYKEVMMNYKIAYAPRGFLFDYTNINNLKEFTTRLKKLLGKQGFISITIDPYLPVNIRNKDGKIININNESNIALENLKASGYNYLGPNLFFESKKPRFEAIITLNDDIKDIYHDICALNVLSCIEIDKAKKEFDISSTREINDIKNKWMRRTFDKKTIKPAFLGFIAQTKGYRDPQKKKYNYHRTTMDYLLREVNRYRSDKSKGSNFTSLASCFKLKDFNENSVNWKQVKSIIRMCETCVSSINAVWEKEYYSNQEKMILSNNYKESLVSDVQSYKVNKHTLYQLILSLDNRKYSHASKLLFYVLFNFKNETLIEMMIDMKPATSYIAQNKNGDLELYGIKFKKYGGTVFDQK